MSLVAARKKRTTLYLSIAGLMVMVAAVSAISARDPSGVSLRVGMIMVTVGAALWLPWRLLIPAVLLAWLSPNLARNFIDDVSLVNLNMALELPGLAGVAFFTVMARLSLRQLEQENLLIGTANNDLAGLNPETGLFDASQLRPALEAELARSRRFRRSFSLVLVGIDEMRQKYDYRDEVSWKASLGATTRVLRETRHNVDRVFHYKGDGFAMILPEATENDIPGLVKRLRRLARSMKPAEGEPGGPMPVHFGATFFPECATTVDDLLMRAEVALRIAGSNTTRYQLDSAEAPELPPAETLRRERAAATTAPQTIPPPAVTNPVAAAIVGEAYAERTREAEAAAEQNPEASPPGPEGEHAEPVGPSEANLEVAAALSGEAAVAEEIVSGVGAPALAGEEPAATLAEPELVAISEESLELALTVSEELVPEIEAPALAVEEPTATTPSEPEPVALSEEAVETLIPSAAVPAAETPEPAIEALPVSMAEEVSEDFEALLKQMDETLKMIRSVRNQAA